MFMIDSIRFVCLIKYSGNMIEFLQNANLLCAIVAQKHFHTLTGVSTFINIANLVKFSFLKHFIHIYNAIYYKITNSAAICLFIQQLRE